MFNPLTDCLSLASRRLSRVVSQIYDDALLPIGLKITQFSVLTAISKAQKKHLPMSDIAQAIDMSQSSLTRAIAPFIRDGFVTYSETKDKRCKAPILTQDGEALLQRATEAWTQAQSKIELMIGPELMKESHQTMQKVRDRISKT